MFKTAILFLLTTASTCLQAAPEPKTQVLPGGVHTYVWERPKQGDDTIELRLVIPVGLIHENGDESGSCAALADILETEWVLEHDFPHPVLADARINTTTFEVELPYNRIDYLHEIFALFAHWTRSWSPQESSCQRLCCQLLPRDYRAMAAYAGRGELEYITSLPSIDTLTEFYNLTYRSLPIAVIAVGEFDADYVEGLIVEAFSTPRSDDPRPLPEVGVYGKWPKQVELDLHYDPRDNGPPFLEVYLTLAAQNTAASLRQVIAQGMLAMHLSLQFSTWLDYDLVTMPNCRFLSLKCDCLRNGLITKLQKLDEVLCKIVHEGISKKELEEIRKPFEAFFTPLAHADIEAERLADSCVGHFRDVGFLLTADTLAAIQQAVATVTSEEIRACAASFSPCLEARSLLR